MRIDLGLVLGVAIEFILFLYYANTTLYPKKNYYVSSAIAFVGHVVIFVIAIFGQPMVNAITFIVVNLLIFIFGYHVDFKDAIFLSVMLTIFSFLGEILLMFILEIGFNSEDILRATSENSIILTIASKLIYFVGIIMIRGLNRKKQIQDGGSFLLLMLVPITTFICILLVISMNIDKQIFLVLCILSFTVNFITFAVNEYIISKNRTIRILEEENLRNSMELKEYNLLSDSYEQSRIFRHDVKEHINNLKILMKEDNQAAMKCIQSLENVYADTVFVKYTDNKILNVLLIQKEKECRENGIKMHISSTNPELDFIDGIDIVAIFSNLINNAIEACLQSAEKEIFVDLCTANSVFTTIKIENSADKEPTVVSGMLRTSKQDKDNHGIGIKSINNSLRKYNGEMSWKFDKINKMFKTTVMINKNQPFGRVN